MKDAHAPLETDDGAAQLAAAGWGAAQFAPRGADVARLAGRMRALGPQDSAALVAQAYGELSGALLPDSLEGAAARAAAGLGSGDPGRPMVIVAAQVRLVRASGPRAVAAAGGLVLHARAFNAVMPEWAAGAHEYGRDGAAEEAADAVEGGRFARRPDDQFRFTAMSIDLGLRRYEDNQVKMCVRRDAIMPPVHVVRYFPFAARLDSDVEEVDSPKSAGYADECEVRLPDGARLGPGGMRVMARTLGMDPTANRDLERLRRLGVPVVSLPGGAQAKT